MNLFEIFVLEYFSHILSINEDINSIYRKDRRMNNAISKVNVPFELTKGRAYTVKNIYYNQVLVYCDFGGEKYYDKDLFKNGLLKPYE